MEKTIENIKKEKLPIIIFGASTVGEVLYNACCDLGIKVECFCDNNINKTKKTMCGIKVIYAKELKTRYKDAIFLISVADIKDVVNQLKPLGYKWYAGSLLLRDFDIYKYKFSVPTDFVEYAVATCILCHNNYLTDKLFLRSVDIIITERCSLRCKDCSNLMQYYENPVDCNVKELIKTINRFCSIVDEINEFRVIGGEPFMNKDFYIIIKRLINEPKVKRIVIYTNGTIVPTDDKIEYLKNNKVLIIITDYGKLSRNLNTLTQKLWQNKISFYVEKAHWTNCAKIIKHNRNIEQQKEIFRNCCAKNLVTLSNNKLYRCPFSANADRLKAIPDFKEYIDVFEDNIEMKKKIRKFLLKKEFLVCDFCNGRAFDDSEIEPAIQIKKPIKYKKYLK